MVNDKADRFLPCLIIRRTVLDIGRAAMREKRPNEEGSANEGDDYQSPVEGYETGEG